MKKSYILPFVAAALIATGCSKENGFEPSEGSGQFLKSALSMDIDADRLNQTRAEANLDDFTVVFTLDGHTEPSAKYRYGDMPEVVTLPTGTYTCTATYGENRLAEWDSPYFLGKSETFEVIPYEICSYVEPIMCKLENIKVTIDFDASLRSAMSSDSYVEVRVGSSGSLNYGLAEADSQKAGFFMHTEEVSLVAIFHGTVDGKETVETKSLKNIAKGNHYKITFTLHNGTGGDGNGDISGTVTTDATVTIFSMDVDVPVGDEPLLDDDDRPNEDDEDDPNPPTPPTEGPTIEAEAPVNLDIVNDGASLSTCVINITSTAEGGIQEFKCVIDSETLTPEALLEVGLPAELDIAHTPMGTKPDGEPEYGVVLQGLELPVNVAGQSSVRFDISTFLGLMSGVGEGQSNFILTVTDANGTTTKTLKIKF